MEIISQLKAERDKVAQQVNALDTGRNTRTPTDERRCTSKNFGVSKSTLGTSAGPEGCLNRPQAPHLSSRSSANQSSKSGEMGEGESGEEIARCPPWPDFWKLTQSLFWAAVYDPLVTGTAKTPRCPCSTLAYLCMWRRISLPW